MRARPSQAVVYLARGADGGIEKAQAFLASYAAHPAGLAHDLIILAKAWRPDDLKTLKAQANALSAQVLELPDDGLDLGAYIRAQRRLAHQWIAFFNTHSRILAPGWLSLLRIAVEQPGVGVAGASGSWESITGLPLPVLSRYLVDIVASRGWIPAVTKVAKAPVRFAWYAPEFPLFPNPFLRTTAFIVNRAVFDDYAETVRFPQTKRDTSLMENGRASFTRYFKRRGLRAVVVGANGKVFEDRDWDKSGTFRTPGQTNLLVADNRTDMYLAASPYRKRELERITWGRAFTF